MGGDEVAFGCENLGVPCDEIWPRVRAALEAVGLELPLDHPTSALSGGQKQRLAIAAVLFAALPFVQDHVGLFLALYIAACLSTSITITAAFAMIAATVDYHEARFGVRREGLLSAGISLSTKLGMALGTAGFAFVLAASGYAPGHVTDTAREAIRWTWSGGAVVLLALQTIVILLWPITDTRKA